MGRPFVTALLGAAVVLAVLGCGSDADETSAARMVDPASEAIRAAVQSNMSVALKLHSKLREQPGNLFYSPISIEAVLGMLYAGANGETADQIGALLDVQADPRALHEGLGQLLADLAGDRSDRGYTLSLADRLWGAPDLKPSDEFVETTHDLYNAPVESADYGDPETVRERINAWVAGQTQGKIPELLRPDDVGVATLLTVVNAIYFKAHWLHGFDPKNTSPAPFHRADGTDVTVQMMRQRGAKLRTAVTADAVLVELPYRGGDISFLAYAPLASGGDQQVRDVSELEAELDADKLDELIGALEEGEPEVDMPRFTLHSRLDLIATLEALGVVDLFDPSLADLSKIDPRALYVKPFVHEATIQVDETGTVAAAATAAGVLRHSAPVPVQLNRPFLFFIRDDLTGAILFTGRVADPTAQ